MSGIRSGDSSSRKVHVGGGSVSAIPAKRLYRGVQEYVRRLENGRQHRRNTMSLFVPEQIGLRIKLRDACEKLMFTYPLEYGQRAEELIWRKVYYEVIQLVKRSKRFEKPNAALTSYYRQLLQSGIGFYHHILLKLQAYFDIESELDWPFTASPLSNKSKRYLFDRLRLTDIDNTQDNAESENQLKQCVQNLCYRFFMCLGDLGRYQLDFGLPRFFAERFYLLALHVKPTAGMPYNQLGTLAGHYQWWGLNAAYYYYKCLETEGKFEGAESNLQKLLYRNKKVFYHIPTDALEAVANANKFEREHTRIFIVSFLYLCDLLRPKTYATDVEITGLCKRLIDSFASCLESLKLDQSMDKPQRNEASDVTSCNEMDNPSTMQPMLIFKMTIICIINIFNLQSSRSNRSSAAIAFTLAYFGHLIEFVISLLTQKKKQDTVANANTSENGSGDSNLTIKSQNNFKDETLNENKEAGDGDMSRHNTKKSKQSRHKRKRRKRNGYMGDSDLSEGEENKPVMVTPSTSEDSSTSDEEGMSGTSDSDISQEDVHETKKLEETKVLTEETGLKLANSLVHGQSAMDSLKDISQKMFQPTRRQIQLAPTFLNKMKPKPQMKEDIVDNGVDKLEEEVEKKDEKKQEEAEDEEDKNGNKYSSEEKMANFLKLEHLNYFMQSIKLLCDWLSKSNQVVEACAQNSGVLWSRVAEFANLLPNQEELKALDDDVITLQSSNCLLHDSGDWKQVQELPEDIVLSHKLLKIPSEFANEKIVKTEYLSSNQQSAIRVLCFRSLCHSLCKVEELELSYNEEENVFVGPQNTGEEHHLDIEAVDEMRKVKLMKDMAALRLKNEVTALEMSLGTTKAHDTAMCLYIVPDTLALCYELHKIKRLVASKRFFLVIPKAVIDGLDSLKKELQGARDATRYLETEFKKGNRFIRAQMKDEIVKGVQGERSTLRKNDMQAWRFYRIIECCLYLIDKEKQKHTTGDENSTSGIVAILTRSTDRSVMSLNQINAMSSAQTHGIQIHGAEEFMKNWKRT